MSKAKPMAAMTQISHWVGVSPREGQFVRSAWRGYASADDKVYFTMEPFEFQPRTRVIFGAGCVERVGATARELKFQRTLLVADAGLVEAGHVAALRRVLDAAPVAAIPYHEFGQNPDSAMVEAGRAFAAPHGVDSIIAIGGGSSLDAAKGINFLLTNGGRMADYRGYGKARTPLLPMIGIPTTAGTGSEAQSYAVIADADSHMKMACGDPSAAFRVAVLDPALTATAPHHVTAMAGFDAIAHAVETAVTDKRTPLSAMYSHEAWRLLSDAFERVLLHPADGEARAAMLLGSHLAGMAIEQSMLGAAHACANPVTAKYGVTHGLALAILLPSSCAGTVASRRIATARCSGRRGAGRATRTAPKPSHAASKISRGPAVCR